MHLADKNQFLFNASDAAYTAYVQYTQRNMCLIVPILGKLTNNKKAYKVDKRGKK